MFKGGKQKSNGGKKSTTTPLGNVDVGHGGIYDIEYAPINSKYTLETSAQCTQSFLFSQHCYTVLL